jgi:hypothetical protein
MVGTESVGVGRTTPWSHHGLLRIRWRGRHPFAINLVNHPRPTATAGTTKDMGRGLSIGGDVRPTDEIKWISAALN